MSARDDFLELSKRMAESIIGQQKMVERLLLVYGESHRHAEALPLFERLLKTPEDIPSDELPDVWLRYARALEGTGRTNEAKTWYARICSEAPGTDAARLARERLEAMK